MDKVDVIYLYTQMHVFIYIYMYSAIKKEWNLAICGNIDRPGECYTKWNKWEKDKFCVISFMCGL